MNLRTTAVTVIAIASLAMPASAYALQQMPDSPTGSVSISDSGPANVDPNRNDGCFVVTGQIAGGPDSSSAADHTYAVSGAGSSPAAERHIEDCQRR
ncbi:hypothetical protein [Intrasporangium oryzae]|uniref:hypothetical protein n=1 Tax=Intrasporangium oryzae TaxID=412687 RepID=UPI00068760FE|nr:hypothetical protein [Intrasporangium oryzae]